MHLRLNYSGPGKGMNPSTKKTLEDLHSDAKKFYTIRENIINEMFNIEDEKLDTATGADDDKRKYVIEAISRLGVIKIMTSRQITTRLPILLAQNQAGNNSQKRNNEIRQFIYSLYRSKNLSKTVFNHLINSI